MPPTLHDITNHQVRLAARPVGLATADNWQLHRRAGGRAGRRRRAGQDAGAVAGPGHARLDERGQELHPAGGHRRGDARRRHRQGGRLAEPGVRGRRPGLGRLGVQEYCLVAAGPDRSAAACSRSTRGWAASTQWLNVLGMPGMTAYFGLLDVGQPKAGRDGGGLGRGRRGGPDRRPAGEDQGLPRRRHRRRAGQVRLGGQGAGLRRLHRLQGRRRCKRRA